MLFRLWARNVVCHLLGTGLLFLAGSAPLLSQSPPAETACAGCHDQGKKLSLSAHMSVGCLKCHPKKEEFPHPEGAPKVACANCHEDIVRDHAKSVHGRAAEQGNAAAPGCDMCHGDVHEAKPYRTAAFRKEVVETCGMCHSDAAEKFKRSVHGGDVERGILNAPVCTDCHGEHAILGAKEPESEVRLGNIRETCGRCHGDVRLSRRFGLPTDRLTSFDSSFHGLAARAGSQTVASCASCHGHHDVLPSSDPHSRTHPDRLPETCGKCHPGAGERFALGPIHVIAGGEEPELARLVRVFYLIVIPLTIGLMFLHQAGDWVRKLFKLRLIGPPPHPAASPQPEMRMYPWERIQHGLLAVSFIVLVWTGFALKYPEQFWSKPLIMWEAQWPIRGILHRIAGVVMIAAGVLHVITLFVSRQLRHHWLELMPRASDVKEGVQGMAYSLGFLRERPHRSSHSYIEKAEYWAVVWGTALMAISGIMLWANNLMLKFLPKSWLDIAVTVHFYEAVLATLAIVVWHFYAVIFDPDVYPMDPAWLTGLSVRKWKIHRGPGYISPEPVKPGSGHRPMGGSDINLGDHH